MHADEDGFLGEAVAATPWRRRPVARTDKKYLCASLLSLIQRFTGRVTPCRQHDPRQQSAAGRIEELHAGAMALGDAAHDGEAEARAAGGRGLAAEEAVEHPLPLGSGDPGACVF